MNNVLKVSSKVAGIISSIGIILVGLVILGITMLALTHAKTLDGKTTGKIIYIEEKVVDPIGLDDDEINYEHTVFVTYEVDGKEYSNVEYGAYNSSMKIGDEVEIEYDTKDPSTIQSPKDNVMIISFIVLSSLAIIFGIYRLIKSIKLTEENSMFKVIK